MQRTGFAPLSSTIRVLAVVISAWSVGPAVAQEEQEAGESKPTYITFTLPPNQGTDLFFVNGSLTVAGTYYKATGGQGAFVRDSRGTITPINPPGSTATVVTGLSQDGTIVGWYAQGGATHGFVRDPFGSITTFDVGLPTFLYRINAAGSFIGATTGQAFVRDANGILTMFNVPGSNGTVPSSINQAGEITGLWFDVNSKSHLFVRNPRGTITVFDPPGAIGFANYPSINRAGAIAGSYYTGSFVTGFEIHGFVRSPQGTINPIDIRGVGNTQVNGINDSGALVGSYGGHEGFVRSPRGTVTSIDVPEAINTMATGISNSGAVTGTYLTFPAFTSTGFLRLPGGGEVEDDGRDSNENKTAASLSTGTL